MVARANEVVGHKPKARGTKIDRVLHIKTDFVRLQNLRNLKNSVF